MQTVGIKHIITPGRDVVGQEQKSKHKRQNTQVFFQNPPHHTLGF
jgi:hypothetical protein